MRHSQRAMATTRITAQHCQSNKTTKEYFRTQLMQTSCVAGGVGSGSGERRNQLICCHIQSVK